MEAFYWYVLCIGILLSRHANDVMFWDAKPILGRKRIALPEPIILNITSPEQFIFTYCISVRIFSKEVRVNKQPEMF